MKSEWNNSDLSTLRPLHVAERTSYMTADAGTGGAAMMCARCHRRMSTATALITTQHGVCGYGPKCARLMGLLIATVKVPKLKTRWRIRSVEVQDDQQAIEGFA